MEKLNEKEIENYNKLVEKFKIKDKEEFKRFMELDKKYKYIKQ